MAQTLSMMINHEGKEIVIRIAGGMAIWLSKHQARWLEQALHTQLLELNPAGMNVGKPRRVT